MNQIEYLKFWIAKEKTSLHQFSSLPNGFLIKGLDKEFHIERIKLLELDLIKAEEVHFFYKNINKNIKAVS
jgi:hypothetical protein|tara:strand:+ start:10900 stop:11112 length:213 start_codon:yes stop_codon:yes gene_type:complete